jgi:hypothetical protein
MTYIVRRLYWRSALMATQTAVGIAAERFAHQAWIESLGDNDREENDGAKGYGTDADAIVTG